MALTFDNFVASSCSAEAVKAARAAAEQKGENLRPLMICAGTGLGKTHLLSAIAGETLARYPEKKVIREFCDTFTGELIWAIQHDTMEAFWEKYLQADLLLIDDLHCVAGKEYTQEIFADLFEKLRQKGSTIVVTADCDAGKLLQGRLGQALAEGIVVEIHAPDYETRLEIARRKAQEWGMDLTEAEAVGFAKAETDNIRRMEGAMRHLWAEKELGLVPRTP